MAPFFRRGGGGLSLCASASAPTGSSEYMVSGWAPFGTVCEPLRAEENMCAFRWNRRLPPAICESLQRITRFLELFEAARPLISARLCCTTAGLGCRGRLRQLWFVCANSEQSYHAGIPMHVGFLPLISFNLHLCCGGPRTEGIMVDGRRRILLMSPRFHGNDIVLVTDLVFPYSEHRKGQPIMT